MEIPYVEFNFSHDYAIKLNSTRGPLNSLQLY